MSLFHGIIVRATKDDKTDFEALDRMFMMFDLSEAFDEENSDGAYLRVKPMPHESVAWLVKRVKSVAKLRFPETLFTVKAFTLGAPDGEYVF